jgi:hypothetical protein
LGVKNHWYRLSNGDSDTDYVTIQENIIILPKIRIIIDDDNLTTSEKQLVNPLMCYVFREF